MDCLIKKIVCFTSVTVIILGMLAGCGSGVISKENLGIEYEGKKYFAGDTLPEDVDLYGGNELCLRKELAEGAEFYTEENETLALIYVNDKRKIWDIAVPQKFQGKGKILCGVQLGDSLEKVISVFGKNLQYDEFKNGPSFDAKTGFFHIVYYYYADNGRLYGISDRINTGHYVKDKMDKEEKEYYGTVKDKLQTEAYRVGFGIRDGKVATVEFLAGDIRYIGKRIGAD